MYKHIDLYTGLKRTFREINYIWVYLGHMELKR